MPLTLYVDEERWTEHLHHTVTQHPRIIPVVKGNAYGIGMETLASRAQSLGVDAIAVGIYDELQQVMADFDGDVVVMTPWRPGGELPHLDDAQAARVIHSVGRVADLERLVADDGPGGRHPRVVLELGTSMRRHGLVREELAEAAALLTGVQVEGLTLHLPLVPPASAGEHAWLGEVEAWLGQARDAGLPTHRVLVSHLSSEEVATLSARHPSVEWRPRVGTSLWVGDSSFLDQRSTVVDVHRVGRGDRAGYSQLRIPDDGRLVVVAGGSSNGVQPQSPRGLGALSRRTHRVVRTGLGCAAQWLSDFEFDDERCWLSEPPHMQASSLFFPDGKAVPEVGDEIVTHLDHASATFDRVRFV